MDPPYNHEWEKKVLELLGAGDYLSRDGVIIIEASLETKMDYIEEFGFELVKEKIYKTNKHVFLTLGQ